MEGASEKWGGGGGFFHQFAEPHKALHTEFNSTSVRTKKTKLMCTALLSLCPRSEDVELQCLVEAWKPKHKNSRDHMTITQVEAARAHVVDAWRMNARVLDPPLHTRPTNAAFEKMPQKRITFPRKRRIGCSVRMESRGDRETYSTMLHSSRSEAN